MGGMTRKLIYHRPDLCATPSCTAKQPNHYFYCDDCKSKHRRTVDRVMTNWKEGQEKLARHERLAKAEAFLDSPRWTGPPSLA